MQKARPVLGRFSHVAHVARARLARVARAEVEEGGNTEAKGQDASAEMSLRFFSSISYLPARGYP